MTEQTLFNGPGFDDAYISAEGTIYLIPVIPVEDDDDGSVRGEIREYVSGHPISIYYGETSLGTVTNSGQFSKPFTGDAGVQEFTIVSDAAHHIGFLQITRET